MCINLKLKVTIKVVGTGHEDEDCSRCVGADEEHNDGDGDQHLDPFLLILQHRHHPPPRPDLRLLLAPLGDAAVYISVHDNSK